MAKKRAKKKGRKLFGRKTRHYRLGRKVKRQKKKSEKKIRLKKVKFTKLGKLSRRPSKKVESRVEKLAKVIRRRRPILVSVPSTRLYICRIEKNRFAFLGGEKLIPMGLVQSAKRKGSETRILIYPIDTAEHSHLLKAVCAPW